MPAFKQSFLQFVSFIAFSGSESAVLTWAGVVLDAVNSLSYFINSVIGIDCELVFDFATGAEWCSCFWLIKLHEFYVLLI